MLVSFGLVAVTLYNHGNNIVTNSYLLGVERMFSGQNPYLEGGPNADIFKYSPLFGILFYPLSLISSPWLSLIWGFLNCGVYWWGVNRFFRVHEYSTKTLILAFLVLSLELNGSLHYQQINALLIGLSLGGLSYFRDSGFAKNSWKGIGWMSLATNFKVLGLSLMGPLMVFHPIPGLIALFAMMLAPAAILGFHRNMTLHSQWLDRLLGDTRSEGLLDISTVLQRIGVSASSANFVRIAILVLSAPLLIWLVRELRKSSKPSNSLIYAYASLAMSTVLLINPRTESPTFVMAAPAFWATWLMINSQEFCRGLSTLSTKLSRMSWWVAIFMTSIIFNAIWPRMLYRPSLNFKTYGLTVLWALTFFVAAKLLRKNNNVISNPVN